MAEFNLIDHFDRRARLGIAEELKKPDTFMVNTFMNRTKEFAVEDVDLDIRTKSRKMSAYVFRHEEGNLVQATGYSTRTFKTPALKPKIVITPEDVNKRLPAGELYDDTTDLSSTIAELVAEQIEDLDSEEIVRNEEWQVKQAVVDGKIEIRNADKKVIQTIDFKREASLQAALTGTNKWDDADVDILKTVREKRRLIKKFSGFTAQMGLLGNEAADLFLADDGVRDAINTRVSDRGQLKFDLRDDGGDLYNLVNCLSVFTCRFHSFLSELFGYFREMFFYEFFCNWFCSNIIR